MPPPPDQDASEHAAAVAAVVAAVLVRPAVRDRDGAAGPVEAFCRAVLRRVATAELGMVDVEGVVPGLLDTYELLEERPAGEVSVRVAPVRASWFGPEGGRTMVQVAVDDRPLLFATVMSTLQAAGLRVQRYSHPIVGVRRGPGRRITSVGPAGGDVMAEVLIHVEVAERLDVARCVELADELREALAEAFVADRDGDAIRGVVAVAAERLLGLAGRVTGSDVGVEYDTDTRVEVAGFCRWLLARNFLFVGMRHEPEGSTLGICTGTERGPLAPVDPATLLADEPLVLRRSLWTSRVSRRERLAEVLVADLDDTGTPRGAIRLLGLTTLRGRSERPSGTPWVRRKLHASLATEQIVPGSHDETVFTALFDDLPWDVLLAADRDWIHAALHELLEARQTDRAAVMVRVEPEAEAVLVLIGVPGAEERPELRVALTELLEERLRPVSLESESELGNSGMAMLSFVACVEPGALDRLDTTVLTAELAAASRSWTDRLSEALLHHPGGRGTAIAHRWLPRLPAAYRSATAPDVAAADLAELDSIGGTGDVRLRVLGHDEVGDRLHLRVAVGGPPLELSRLLPVLESTGLVVVEEMTFALGESLRDASDGASAELSTASVLDLVARRAEARSSSRPPLAPGEAARLAETVVACWQGRAQVDRLNTLVLGAGLTWRQVAVLRAYARYLPQLARATTPAAVADALADNPPAASALWHLIESRFDPAAPHHHGGGPAAVGDPGLRDLVLGACDDVARLDQDRVMRDLLALVDATVRTNVWANRRAETVTLAFDGGRLPGRTRTETWRELWVSSPTVEGVHLRAGPVARGGLRWSERTGDLRTEVLQLMRAQELKNALIVPTGAKGGFVLRRRPSDPALISDAVRSAYSVFVRSLLDVVDDLHDGQAVHPEGVVPSDPDDEDAYLVVAPDRGTAGLSDLANSIAAERDYWLGDAFASGGSAGYDHKALGVTARGAWVSVTEHFERLGVDVSTDPVRVVGIGDMSGDVFGNAMLLSSSLRLVAAFDHRHVFLDPDPDPARSLAERSRLFELPGSSWNDYDRSVLSHGGMVIPRSAKRVHPTPEVAELLDLPAAELSLPDVVRAVLATPADLLYFGGIGTFVRAAGEPDGAVGDAANDEVRVTADELRVRVVVEGANLAMTPAARVEFAGNGGLVNADAIDNSAGVDCSDHEVNLKILLRLAEQDGRLDRAGRDERLAAVADDVVATVLSDVSKQNRALTREVEASKRAIEPFLSLLFAREADGRLDRETHALPSGSEVGRRREAHEGLRRPELAVVMAATKEWLAGEVLDSGLVDAAPLRELLEQAFPPAMVVEFGDLLDRHPLRERIVASRLANEIVDRMGMTWVPRVGRRSAAPPAVVAAAYWMARETARLGDRWRAIDAAALADRDRIWDPAAEVMGVLVGDYLRRGVAARWRWEEIERNATAARVLASTAGPLHDIGEGTGVEGSIIDAGALRRLALAPSLADVARRAGCDPTEAVGAFAEAGERFGMDRLTWALLRCDIDSDDAWGQRHREGLLFDVDRLRRATAVALLEGSAGEALEDRLEVWSPRLDEAIAAADDRLDPLAVSCAELWLLVEELVGRIPRARPTGRYRGR